MLHGLSAWVSRAKAWTFGWRNSVPTVLLGLGLLLGPGVVWPTFAQAQEPRWGLKQMVRSTNGRATYHAKPVDTKFRNLWPRELEEEFQQRARSVLAHQTETQRPRGNTYFENEKRSYGFLMAHVLAGRRELALKQLQAEDAQHREWHRETKGIDYYACFTLKHQIRKYFYFGDLLEPAYRQRMYEGAQRWTERDPLRRSHYAYDPSKQGWGPDARNSWVDVRNTENLWLMRTTSVYLMAEETGNKTTAEHYRDQILKYAATLYRVGMGEWDSENYLGHSIGPLLNLYDFARDSKVRMAAKACLDFYAAAGAVKYWRGGFNGPTKRDYNHAQPFGGSAANILWLWFGDHPAGKKGEWESDEIHVITSAYRPPVAVVELAHKKFERPQEIFAAKPGYEATTKFLNKSSPEYLETQFIGHTFQLGSLTQGTSVDGGDVNGFKILVFDEVQGAFTLQAVPGNRPKFPGSPMYQTGVVAAPNRVAQQRNLAIWLVKDGASPWLWVIPDSIEVQQRQGVTFLKCDQTWVAITPLGVSELKEDASLTGELTSEGKKKFSGHKVLSARGMVEGYCGLAVEVGEKSSHGTFQDFVADVLSAEVDTDELAAGIARYRDSNGQWLGIHWNDDPKNLGVWRNGTRRNFADAAIYKSDVISAKWGSGELNVETDRARFGCRVHLDGTVEFQSSR